MWALGAPALLLLLLQAAGVQGQVCPVEQKVESVSENSTEALNVVLAVVTLPPGQSVRVSKESEEYFTIKNENQLFLHKTPDFEETQILFARLECLNQGTTDLVGSRTVRLLIKDINDNAPTFSQETYTESVTEEARVNTIVVPASKLQATDKDQSDVLFYELKEVTPEASKFFSLVSRTQPGLRLSQALDYGKLARMTFTLLVRDTENENQTPSHTASATVVVDVVPADLRPPWFLPCVHNDSHICVQAQYKGIVPIDVNLPYMLSFSPGPIYAVDGDWAINEEIIYSLKEGVDNEMFSINSSTGNLTMHKHAPNPKTFLLLVTARQKSGARYSVTQVSVEVTSKESYASFPLNLYHGFLVLGQGAGIAVKDAADPSQPLTLRAQDTHIQEYNRNFEYKITNNTNFRMEGEAVLTTSLLVAPGTYAAKVEAYNTVTKSNATTVVEIRVSPEPTSAPGTEQPGSTGPSSTVQMAALGGVLGALLLLALVALVVLVCKHYGHRFNCCCSRTRLKSQPKEYDNETFVGDSEANWNEANAPVTRSAGDEDPPAPSEPAPSRLARLGTPEHTPTEPTALEPTKTDLSALQKSAPPPPPSAAAPSPPVLRAADSPPPVVAQTPPEGSSPQAVRSILTKERRPEGGYKAVWFGEDIGAAEADVVVLNAPTTGVDDDDDGNDSHSEGDGDPGGDLGEEDGYENVGISVVV
ncbi:cadherin-related family member 5 [Sorex fumeus]|uniref:cadherin-related family member 5 n=1 Tax=Sorex fumeus TaxID=62283 RepID=UPI0024AC8C3F|nr:cadherin-related family member 5 [Sorex fumeus]